MAITAVLGALGGLLGAGGDIAGGLLGGEKKQSPITAANIPQFDPLIAQGSFQALLGLGIVDPFILQQSSPLNQIIATYNELPLAKKQKVHDLGALSDALQAIGAGSIEIDPESGIGNLVGIQFGFIDPTKAIASFADLPDDARNKVERIFSQVGYTGSLEDLFAQQQSYEQGINTYITSLGDLPQVLQQSRNDLLRRQAEALAGFPGATEADIQALQKQEADRLLSNLSLQTNERQQDILRAANFGGFNPGRGLAELDRIRAESAQNIDLTALNTAISLLGGEQALAGNELAALSAGLNDPLNTLLAFGQARTNSQSSVSGLPNVGTTLGAGLANAGQQIGSAIAAIPQLQQNQQLTQALLQSLTQNAPASYPLPGSVIQGTFS